MPGKIQVVLPAPKIIELPVKRCPDCVVTNQRSKVTPGAVTMTSMAWLDYYDENGLYHSHNPNTRTISYRCSNGHEWQEEEIRPCWCGLTGVE